MNNYKKTSTRIKILQNMILVVAIPVAAVYNVVDGLLEVVKKK